jgi:hypothetical protein
MQVAVVVVLHIAEHQQEQVVLAAAERVEQRQ